MYGRIVKFRKDLGVGIIHTEEGDKFRFATSEVVNTNDKLVGTDVDFLIAERKPREIILMVGSPWTAFGQQEAA